MTLTVDDLVSSLSNSCHISQEAIDIATLQVSPFYSSFSSLIFQGTTRTDTL